MHFSQHYYRAVVWYHIAASPKKALDEIYHCLNLQPEYDEAFRLAQSAGHDLNIRLKNFSDEENREYVLDLLSFIDAEDTDRFLTGFLSHEDIGNYAIRKIDWDFWINKVSHSSKSTDRIWYFILKENFQTAISLCENLCVKKKANVIVYFQISYLFMLAKKFDQAEDYLKLLLRFGGIYRLSAIRLLLQLPTHKFKSLTSFTDIYNAEISEKFQIAEVLQKSWDKVAFQKMLSLLGRKADDAIKNLRLARIYLHRNDYKSAVYYLKQSYYHDPENIPRLLKYVGLGFLQDKSIASFLKWLLKRISEEKNLKCFAKFVRESLPKLAFSAYRKLEKRGETPENLFSKALCYYYLEEFDMAEKLASKVLITNFPQSKVLALKARILYRKGFTQKAFDLLQNSLQRFPCRRVLLDAFEEISSSTCPVCLKYKNLEACAHCGYENLNVFDWQEGKLRWNAKKLDFPSVILILTTNCQAYKTGQSVHIVFFASYSVEFRTFLYSERKSCSPTQYFFVTWNFACQGRKVSRGHLPNRSKMGKRKKQSTFLLCLRTQCNSPNFHPTTKYKSAKKYFFDG